MSGRNLWLAMLLAAMVIVPRSALIARAHSECVDDEYHLARGLAFWERRLEGTRLNDPPLGEAISAMPLLVTGCELKDDGHVLYAQPLSLQTLLVLVAIWKSILFLPLIGGAFVWLQKLYNVQAAWLGAALLTIEPNFAAFIPSPSIDVLAVEGIFFAAWAAWRYFERPSMRRLSVLVVLVAAAILLKHTALFLPVVIVLFALIWRRIPPWRHLLLAPPMFLLALWALLLFDISRPARAKFPMETSPLEEKLLSMRVPGGSYIGSIILARGHVTRGHPAYLLGDMDKFGWWYYLPVVATYKAPIPIFLLAAVAIVSLAFIRPRWDEWMILICFLGWSLYLMHSRISIGFRHFLPAYLFFLLLLPRVMCGAMIWTVLASLCIAATAIHGALWHPNYLSYINYPREKVWLDINDSNLDWGQALKQAARWIDVHPEHRDRPIYLGFFPGPGGPHVRYHLGERVVELSPHERPPLNGIVILSPMWIVGTYHPQNHYELLQQIDPIDVIGDAMPVYDLDRIRNWKKFARPKPATAAATTSVTN